MDHEHGLRCRHFRSDREIGRHQQRRGRDTRKYIFTYDPS